MVAVLGLGCQTEARDEAILSLTQLFKCTKVTQSSATRYENTECVMDGVRGGEFYIWHTASGNTRKVRSLVLAALKG